MDSILSAFRDWKEWRRRRALALKEQGWTQRAIAQALGVSEAAVSQWLAAARQAGPGALRSHPPPGVAPKLTAAQKRLTPEFLWHGPEAYGFRGQVWACARIAKVIEEEFGVSYHKGHVGRLLAELRWTPQVPIRRSCVKSSTSPSAAFDRSPGWCNPSLRRPFRPGQRTSMPRPDWARASEWELEAWWGSPANCDAVRAGSRTRPRRSLHLPPQQRRARRRRATASRGFGSE